MMCTCLLHTHLTGLPRVTSEGQSNLMKMGSTRIQNHKTVSQFHCAGGFFVNGFNLPEMAGKGGKTSQKHSTVSSLFV